MQEKPRRKPSDNLRPIPFTKDNQPPAEKKSAGWERKRQAKKILDEMLKYQDMDMALFTQLLEQVKKDMKDGKSTGMTVGSYITAKYVAETMKGKTLVHYLDKIIPNAPSKTEITGEDGDAIKVIKIGEKDK